MQVILMRRSDFIKMKKSRKTEQEWKQLLAACKARSKGIRIPDWCHQQGISLDTYKYWQRKLGNKYNAQSAKPEIQFVSYPYLTKAWRQINNQPISLSNIKSLKLL